MAALALSSAGRLKPEIRLAQAVSQFEADLSTEQKATFRTDRSKARDRPPNPEDVMQLTARIDRSASQNAVRTRGVGPRLTNVLQAIQQYVSLGDVVIGGSQNLVACGVWALVRTSLLLVANHSTYLEKLSLLFMMAGKSAPIYQQMAILYPRSKTLQASLNEYLIVVVQICHRVLKFSKKSYLSQLAATFSDADIKQYQTDLEHHAALIKEDVHLLMGQRLDDEARENSKFRAISNKFSETAAYKRKLKQRLHILNSCSTFDHQTPWKQARKTGNTRIFEQDNQYVHWRAGGDSRTLVCTGKLGSGKSVLMANLVDDLSLYAATDKLPIAYYFCRYDIQDSLRPRTVIGSIARQLLSTLPDLKPFTTEVEDWASTHEMDTDDLLAYFRRNFIPKSHAYIVIDGLDECSKPDQKTLLTYCRSLQEDLKLMLCLSFRLEADNHLQLSMSQFVRPEMLQIPENNPELFAFIDAELQARIADRSLSLGDPHIEVEIRDALLQGAQGMFLWVSLQINTLCEEQTDEKIRAALKNLPKSLSGTFARILERASGGNKELQRPILELVAVARRPLTAEELREAISVTPGDTDWNPAKLVNNVYSTLSCCGSLVTVDEEEKTIRLVHNSVKQFLVGDLQGKEDLDVDLEDANRRMGQIILTYLNYNIFDTQLSTTVVPEVFVGSAPEKILNSVATSKKSKAMALMLKSRMKMDTASNPNYNIGHVLAEHSRQFHKRPTHDVFAFHEYAKSQWLFHTTSISDMDKFSYTALRRLINDPEFDLLSKNWGHESLETPTFSTTTRLRDIVGTGKSAYDDMRPKVEQRVQVVPEIFWALRHSHLPLLRHYISAKGRLKSVASIFICISSMVESAHPPTWHRGMCTQLLPYAAARGSTLAIQSLLDRGASMPHNNYCSVSAAICSGSLPALGLLLQGTSVASVLKALDIDPVLEACQSAKPELVKFLISHSADVNQFSGSTSPLYHMLDHIERGPEYVEAVHALINAGARFECSIAQLSSISLVLIIIGNPSLLKPLTGILTKPHLNQLLYDCCWEAATWVSPPDSFMQLAKRLLELGADPDYFDATKGGNSMSLALMDDRRLVLLELLLTYGASPIKKIQPEAWSALEFCLVSRFQEAIKLFLAHGLKRRHIFEAILQRGLVHRYIQDNYFSHVEFLCGFTGFNITDFGGDIRVGKGRPPLMTAILCNGSPGMILDIAFRGADLNESGPTGTTTPLQAVLNRVTVGENWCFHNTSGDFLRVARTFVAAGARVDDICFQRVLSFCSALFTHEDAVELDASPLYDGVVHGSRVSESQRSGLLNHRPPEDSVQSLVIQLLREMTDKHPLSVRDTQRLTELWVQAATKHSISLHHNLQNSPLYWTGEMGVEVPHGFISFMATILAVLAAGLRRFSNTEDGVNLELAKADVVRAIGYLLQNDIRWAADTRLVYVPEEFPHLRLRVPFYSLLENSQELHEYLLIAQGGLQDDDARMVVKRAINTAIYRDDVQSARAGLRLLREVEINREYEGKVRGAVQKLEELNRPAQEGVYYELSAGPDVSMGLSETVVDMTPYGVKAVELPGSWCFPEPQQHAKDSQIRSWIKKQMM